LLRKFSIAVEYPPKSELILEVVKKREYLKDPMLSYIRERSLFWRIYVFW
jgi:hypothetical protein